MSRIFIRENFEEDEGAGELKQKQLFIALLSITNILIDIKVNLHEPYKVEVRLHATFSPVSPIQHFRLIPYKHIYWLRTIVYNGYIVDINS